MSNAIITGRIVPVRSVSGTIGAIPTLHAAFTTPKQYAGSPLTTGTVYHKNIIRTLDVPTTATSAEIEKAVS